MGIKSSDDYKNLRLDIKGCIEVRIHSECAVLTLVGGNAPASDCTARVMAAIDSPEAFVVSTGLSELAITVVAPQRDLRRSAEALHKEFFRDVDPKMFATVERRVTADAAQSRSDAIGILEKKASRPARLILARQ